jgi:predicted O-methyltransferase YrrM
MDDQAIIDQPPALQRILRETAALGFTMASDALTGSLLRTLVASKPGGSFLELGTGTGVGTSWMIHGMDQQSRLETVENNAEALQIARRFLGSDSRVLFHLQDGVDFLRDAAGKSYDLIYADTWPGKFTHLDEALALLKVGGIYLVDDLLPQPNWPPEHPPKVPKLIAELESRKNLVITKMRWTTGLLLAVRVV